MASRAVRRTVIVLVLLFLAVNLTAALGLLWLRTSVPQVEGTVTHLAGLNGPATIRRNDTGVLWIEAGRPADASFALGFAHAQDRLWQMEIMRRIGAGRLSELIGESGLTFDRMLRTLGLYRLAGSSFDRLDTDARNHLLSYAAGVNAYLETRSGTLPPEFLLLGADPEPWTPADSLVWGRLMALQLSGNWFDEILRARLLKAGLTVADLELLWSQPDAGEAAPGAAGDRAATVIPAPVLAGLRHAFPAVLQPRLASNGWALSGTRTPGGHPVLAGDPHLGFTDPNLWSLARVSAPGYLRVGAYVPGVPFLLLGHNGDVAWTMVTTHSDTQDLFVERLDPEDDGRYLTPDGPVPFATRTERLRVGDETVDHVVRLTRHGPVVSDVVADAGAATEEGTVLALASPVLAEDDDTAQALYDLGAASDVDAVATALSRFHSPQQNVVFADRQGRIGMIAAGRVPIRRAGDGWLPSPGWSGEADWLGWASFSALPRVQDPPGGAIVTANDRVVGAEPDLWLGRDFDSPYRAARIADLLADSDGSPDAMAALQRDTVSLFARTLVPQLLDHAGNGSDPLTSAALGLVARWDGDMDARRPEPLIFSAWTRALHHRLFADDLGGLIEDYRRVRAPTLLKVLSTDTGWCDDRGTPGTEDCGDIVRAALTDSLAGLARDYGSDPGKWRWGDAHQAEFSHRVWSRIPVLRDILAIRSPTGGGNYTVSRGTSGPAGKIPFPHVHGAGFRAVYDLGDLDRSQFVAAVGASGNPLSPYYGSWQSDWAAGRMHGIPPEPGPDAVLLTLTP